MVHRAQTEREPARTGDLVRNRLTLTERELAIVTLLGSQLCVAEIAELLKISSHTVANHKRSIYAKFGVGNRSHAVSMAISMGLFDDSPGPPAPSPPAQFPPGSPAADRATPAAPASGRPVPGRAVPGQPVPGSPCRAPGAARRRARRRWSSSPGPPGRAAIWWPRATIDAAMHGVHGMV